MSCVSLSLKSVGSFALSCRLSVHWSGSENSHRESIQRTRVISEVRTTPCYVPIRL